MDIRLDGKSAIITGGSKGLGLAIAKEYAASGADVAIIARDAAALADAKAEIGTVGGKGKILAISCDVSKAGPIEAACAQCNSEFGKVDIFVNNAGQSTRGPSETITDEQWQADLDLKLFAQIRFCRILMPQMKARKWGRIISVLNIGAKAPGADSARVELDRLSTRGRAFLGSELAIMGGAMTWVSERNLVAAISNAGGFGVIASGSMSPDLLQQEITATAALTDRPFGVNIITMHPQLNELIDVCLARAVGHVVLAGGLPPVAGAVGGTACLSVVKNPFCAAKARL